VEDYQRTVQEFEEPLVVYPNSNQGITRPSYQKDRMERYLAWYAKYLKPASEKE